LAGFEKCREALKEEGAVVIAGSVDSLEKTEELAADKQFPFAYGMKKEDGDVLGSWYQQQREFIQPSEFVLGPDGKVLFSSYSDGPLGRMVAEETLTLLKYLNGLK